MWITFTGGSATKCRPPAQGTSTYEPETTEAEKGCGPCGRQSPVAVLRKEIAAQAKLNTLGLHKGILLLPKITLIGIPYADWKLK